MSGPGIVLPKNVAMGQQEQQILMQAKQALDTLLPRIEVMEASLRLVNDGLKKAQASPGDYSVGEEVLISMLVSFLSIQETQLEAAHAEGLIEKARIDSVITRIEAKVRGFSL